MPNPKKKGSVHEEYSRISEPGSKKILIEQTTILTVLALLAIKLIAFLLPGDVSAWWELLASLPSDPLASPALLGGSLSLLTWQLVYLDSAAPGVDPPSPLSPAKYREASGADFHINYIFAMLVGPLVAAFMYAGWV